MKYFYLYIKNNIIKLWSKDKKHFTRLTAAAKSL